MKRKPLISDDALVAKLSQKVTDSAGWPGSPVSKDNGVVIQYYNSELPKRASKGRSSYVSSDVYDAVESMKAQMLETFSAGRRIIQFNPYSAEDIEQARLETKYVDHVVFTQNNGFELFHDVIHDGLTARKGVAEAFWDERITYDTTDFEGLPEEAVLALHSDPTVDELNAELDEGTQTYSGTYRTKLDNSQVCLDPVPPEEYFVERGLKRREDGIRGRRKVVTKADLRKRGYPKKKIDKVKWETDLRDAPEKLARENPVSGYDSSGDSFLQPELETTLLYEAYVELVMYEGEESSLWRIVYAGDVLFEKEQVDEDPFVEFNPLRIPHTVWGNSYAGRVKQTQNARTALTRGVLDHTNLALNPRWEVVQGGLVNPKEMLDSRLGGLVQTTRPDAVRALEYPNLNPFVYQTLEMLKSNKEEQTGISALSKGLNKDAISSQNSNDMIDTMISVSQIRQKVVARFFANSFLEPLYQKIWKLVAKYEKRTRIISIAGDFQPVDPAKWRNPRTCWISKHLGYRDAEKQAAKHDALYDGLNKDPASSRFFKDGNRYKMIGDLCEAHDVENWRDYVPPPDQWDKPQPNPIEMMKAQAADKQAQASLISAQATAQKAQVAEQREQLRTQNDTAKTVAQVQKTYADAERQNLETVNRVDVEQRKVALEETMRPKEHEADKAAAATPSTSEGS